MGKQKHDLGRRKRALNDRVNGERRRIKPTPDFAIGQPPSQFYLDNLYGPPEHVRKAAHEMRQAGMPDTAQRILDGRIRVEDNGSLAADGDAPKPPPRKTRKERRG